MDLRGYYQKIRRTEETLRGEWIVVIDDSSETGIATEVSRRAAAQLIVDGKARVANDEEATQYHLRMAEARRKAEEQQALSRGPMHVLSDSEFRNLRQGPRSKG